MAKQTINLGTSETSGDGESIRSAFDKCNDNFSENYASIASIESDISALDGTKIVFGDLSVATASASGAGALSYDSSTGVFTFTPAAAGFDGDYNSLTNTPTIPADVSDLTDTTNLLDHFSGSYNDLSDKPTIPTVPTTVSSFTNDSGYITGYTVTEADVTAHQAALTITESQISDLSHTAEVNDLTAAVTWANVPDANITQSSVTQHQAALTITESQISDLTHFSGAYADLTGAPTAVSAFTNDAGYLTSSSSASSISIISTTGTDQEFPLLFVSGSGNHTPRVDATKLTFNPSSDTLSVNSATVTSTKISNWDTAHGWGNHASAGYVESDTTGITGADQVSNIVTLTQAEYDAIGTPNASTVYIIVG
jgi:hypothetical protein